METIATAKLLELSNEIDQLNSDAIDFREDYPEIERALEIAWYFSERAIRTETGECSARCNNSIDAYLQFCSCCHYFNQLRTVAESLEGRL